MAGGGDRFYFQRSVPTDGYECFFILGKEYGQEVAAVNGPQTEDRERIAMMFAASPELLEIVRISIGNVRSLGPAGALAKCDQPYREWLTKLEAAYYMATGKEA